MKIGIIDTAKIEDNIIYELNPSNDFKGEIQEIPDNKVDEIITSIEKENANREILKKENDINNAHKLIEDLRKLPNEQQIVLNSYLIKLIMNSSHFSEIEKNSINLIIEDYTIANEKEFELNNIEEIKNNINSNEWQSDTDYYLNDYVLYEGNLYKVIQSHKSQSNWLPNLVPALYKLLAKKEEVEDIETPIPEFIQPTGSHNAYNIGDKVKFNNKIYESLINNNTWSPTAYPAGWKEII